MAFGASHGASSSRYVSEAARTEPRPPALDRQSEGIRGRANLHVSRFSCPDNVRLDALSSVACTTSGGNSRSEMCLLSLLLGMSVLLVVAGCGGENGTGGELTASSSEGPGTVRVVAWETPDVLECALEEVRTFNAVAAIVGGATVPEADIQAVHTDQNPLAAAVTLRKRTLRAIEAQVDTSWLFQPLYMVFNPLPWPRHGLVTLDITDFLGGDPFQNVQIQNWKGLLEPSQLIRLPGPRFLLSFVARDVPAWGWSVFSVRKDINLLEEPPTSLETSTLPDLSRTIDNPRLTVSAMPFEPVIGVVDKAAGRALLSGGGVNIVWLDAGGTPQSVRETRQVEYHHRKPVFAMMRITDRGAPGQLHTDLAVYHYLPWLSIHIATEPLIPDQSILAEFTPSFTPESGGMTRGPGTLELRDASGGFALLHKPETQMSMVDGHVQMRFPPGEISNFCALLPRAATSTVTSLVREGMNFIHPLQAIEIENHFGNYHPFFTRIESLGQEGTAFHSMLRVEPENVVARRPSMQPGGTLSVELMELEGRACEAEVELVREIMAVDGVPIDATTTVSVPLQAGESRVVRFTLQGQ